MVCPGISVHLVRYFSESYSFEPSSSDFDNFSERGNLRFLRTDLPISAMLVFGCIF